MSKISAQWIHTHTGLFVVLLLLSSPFASLAQHPPPPPTPLKRSWYDTQTYKLEDLHCELLRSLKKIALTALPSVPCSLIIIFQKSLCWEDNWRWPSLPPSCTSLHLLYLCPILSYLAVLNCNSFSEEDLLLSRIVSFRFALAHSYLASTRQSWEK